MIPNPAKRIVPRLARTVAVLLILALAPHATGQETRPAGAPIGTWPFAYPGERENAQAVLDLSHLNEEEAGISGFVRLAADGNSFVLGDGTPARFWAVNSELFRNSPGEMARHVRFLARIGVNLVRLHTQIGPIRPGARITEVNAQEIDGIWRFVAAAKKAGIYTTISPYWAIPRNVDGWGIEGLTGVSNLWGLIFFDETLQAGYKAWVRELYARKNPYTGIPLSQDPAVAIIQVQNEDSMLFWTTLAMQPAMQARLGKKFGAWLTKKYGSLAATSKAWEGQGHADDDFAGGRVGLHNVWMMTQAQTGGLARRVNDELEFFAATQRSFYASMVSYYRDTLGCRQLINASNWRTADPIKIEDVERWTYAAADVIAVNRYYIGGAHVGAHSGWAVEKGDHFSQQSALLNPREFPLNVKQVVGHPMIVTESAWVSPLAYQSEGPFLVAVYQSLTGVDAFYWFVASVPDYYANDPNFLSKWAACTPTTMGGFPAAALMFRKGYIAQGAPAVHEERTTSSLWNRDQPIIAEGQAFDPNRDRGRAAPGPAEITTGADPLAFLVGPVEINFEGDPKKTRVADLSRFIDNSNKIVRSNTGQVSLDHGNGLCTLDAPKAQGACGFLAKAGVIRLGDVAIRSQNGYATVLVVSMDDQPISTSRKVLVQVTTSARPTGWSTREAEFAGEDGKTMLRGFEILQVGSRPWRVVNSEVGLVLRNSALAKATLLDTAGYAVEQIEGTRKGKEYSLQLPLKTMYLVIESGDAPPAL